MVGAGTDVDAAVGAVVGWVAGAVVGALVGAVVGAGSVVAVGAACWSGAAWGASSGAAYTSPGGGSSVTGTTENSVAITESQWKNRTIARPVRRCHDTTSGASSASTRISLSCSVTGRGEGTTAFSVAGVPGCSDDSGSLATTAAVQRAGGRRSRVRNACARACARA